jgi:hypothetical protein
MSEKLEDVIATRAAMLREIGFLSSADWCDHLHKNLSLYVKHPEEFEPDLKTFLVAFETDFLGRIEGGNRELRQSCLRVIQVLLERAIKNDTKIGQTLRELAPYVERGDEANGPIYKMGKAFNKLDESLLEIQVYGNLFTFMLHVDGQYFPTIKALCGLKLSGDGKKPAVKYLDSLKLEEMKTVLGEFAPPLFDVYENTGHHLRNAIAHCNFKFSDTKLHCWDVNPKTKRVVWKKEFTIYELSSAIDDLKCVSHAFVSWFLLRHLAEQVSRNIGYTELCLSFSENAE